MTWGLELRDKLAGLMTWRAKGFPCRLSKVEIRGRERVRLVCACEAGGQCWKTLLSVQIVSWSFFDTALSIEWGRSGFPASFFEEGGA